MADSRFQPGWPDAFVAGYTVLRTLLDTDRRREEGGLEWQISPGLIENSDRASAEPTLAIIGDLTAWTTSEWAGVRVYATLYLRDQAALGDDDWGLANQLLETHAGWVTHGLYDFAAQGMRTMLGGGSGIRVPRVTPAFTLALVDPADLDDVVDVANDDSTPLDNVDP
ncbi:hypothetical protein [Nocardioides sp. GCM10030258]|uniref:hypothetical protein n=1 Tax=unclassified Nocardioides TaxID=2615069 RepID=UPI00360606B4